MASYTETEKALILLAKIFYKYAGANSDGKDDELERDEMKSLIRKELKNLLAQNSEEDFAKIFAEFDKDGSGAVNFQEFMAEMASISGRFQNDVKKAAQCDRQ